ncbi:MAG TPA: tRNA uridine-5-carboxymethylaminomethyl(34) synthesis GTPase MnmE, partial [Caulobacterales bacterium]|nr:tRNA uridine-5-carboxymethylaminomethyl(34) synthesis GTPase MnmE [Caulobacterales bacterium]
MRDTIFALATGAGRAGVAIVRLSGPDAGAALELMGNQALPAPRVASRRWLTDPASGAPIDDALALWFPAPASFTGEDVCELHIHGGPAVIAATLAVLGALPGLRPALPGEFTRRAFEHGKMDLTAAEGLADLVDAETEGQRRQALRQMEGGLAEIYEGWRARLIEALALYEAEIDFPDEGLPDALAARGRAVLAALASEVAAHLADAHRGERVRDGFRIAIIGPPNAGKSSLLNALTARETAIVSDIPGTTRDVVEARLVIGGFPVWIADTAGLRAARDVIEAEGVRRALARAEQSDLRIGVLDSGAAELSIDAFSRLSAGDVLVLNKSDVRAGAAAEPARAIAAQRGILCLSVSTISGAGMKALHDVLAERVATALGGEEAPALTRER